MKERRLKQESLQMKPGFRWTRVHGGSAALEVISLEFAMPEHVGCMKHPVPSGNATGA
jgi:hypothetical protein